MLNMTDLQNKLEVISFFNQGKRGRNVQVPFDPKFLMSATSYGGFRYLFTYLAAGQNVTGHNHTVRAPFPSLTWPRCSSDLPRPGGGHGREHAGGPGQ